MISGQLLIYAGLMAYRPLRYIGEWSIDWQDAIHWMGILGAVIIASALLLNYFKIRLRAGVWIHCPLGITSFLFALFHSRTKAAVILTVHYASYYILALLGIVVISGGVLRYQETRRWRLWLKLVHGPTTISMALILMYHILVKLAVI
jgi:hypothetical protein